MTITRILRLTRSYVRASNPPHWRRITVGALGLAVCIGLTDVTPASTMPPDKAVMHDVETSTATAKPAPSQLQQLDFLLGKTSCTLTTGTKISASTKPILDGHYYQMDLTAQSQGGFGYSNLTGQWVLGWNSIDSTFISYYYDDAQIQGTSTSPGWQNGHLVFTGTYALSTIRKNAAVQDEFTKMSADHFMIHESIQKDGKWQPLDTQDCYRSANG